MNWDHLDWAALHRMRSSFLGKPQADYWKSLSDIEAYDMTFGQRIAWKWDAVLGELHQRGWVAPSRAVLDWGCGSGIAGRRFIESFGPQNFDALSLWDHSTLACEFAKQQAREKFPALDVKREEPPLIPDSSIWLLSHVLNELTEKNRGELFGLLPRATAIIWVEPGTHEISRDLIAFRDRLLEQFQVVAPCTHQAGCGLMTEGNQKHWCHHFAQPPSHVFRDRNWQRFGRELGIDLRSLPYSFLVLERKGMRRTDAPLGMSRIIGEPRQYKGYCKILSCQFAGVEELMLQKRDDPELFRAIKKHDASAIQKWKREEGRILGLV